MEISNQSQNFTTNPYDVLGDQIDTLKALLSYALNTPEEKIKVNFPTLKNFYFINNVYKSSWAIYVQNDNLPKLLYTGNFLIQGDKYGKRSGKSPFGAKALSPLKSVANTFSYEASLFKQNWAQDLNLFEEDSDKLKFTVKEYQDFLKLLNNIRAQWLLHLSEEGNFDFVICEFSEPSDPIFFVDLESFDSMAVKIKTYFKPISERALKLFQTLASNTEFEGKFYNLQPGTWLRDDVLIELEKYYSAKFSEDEKILSGSENQIEFEYGFNNPFKVQAFRPMH